METIRCGNCCEDFEVEEYPSPGDSVTCPHCNAEGYGTYDTWGYYSMEWYADDEGV